MNSLRITISKVVMFVLYFCLQSKHISFVYLKELSLFYTPVKVENKVTLGAMLDSGSMACSLSTEAQKKLIDAGVQLKNREMTDVVFVGCGGVRVKPESVVNLEMAVYGCSTPVSLVGQGADVLVVVLGELQADSGS